MATVPQASSRSPTLRRILREASELSANPSPDFAAEPSESDLFEWHFTLRGPPNSPFSEGIYHGRIVLPPTYPLRPPSFRFLTPNGRFEANREICLSISGHHEETWQPAWGVRTAIVALRSFMETDVQGQLGGVEASPAVRQRLAAQSGSFKCPTCQKTNAEIIAESASRCSPRTDESPEETELPPGLQMKYKDTSGDGENPSVRAEPTQPVNTASEAALSPSQATVGSSAPAAQASPFEARQPQHVETNVGGRAGSPPEQHPPRTVPAHLNTGINAWIDRAIVALVVALVALLLKIMFVS